MFTWLRNTIAPYGLIVPIWLAWALGLVRVYGRQRCLRHMKQDGVLLLPNHPSMLETTALPALFWHLTWLGWSRVVPWSVADQNTFGPQDWIYQSFRCVRVHRKKNDDTKQTSNYRAIKEIRSLLSADNTVICYVEGGRTCKKEAHDVYTCKGDRRLRPCQLPMVRLAWNKKITIIPIWVDFGDSDKPQSLWQDYLKLFRGTRLTITFGEPIHADTVPTQEMVADAILSVGLQDG